jgi:Uma2 family endonuclease
MATLCRSFVAHATFAYLAEEGTTVTTSQPTTVEDVSAPTNRPTPPRQRLTVDDLDCLPEDDILRELVDGELREWTVPGPEHGAIELDLAAELRQFVKEHRLGHVMSGEVRFRIKGDIHHARLADVAFVAAGKYPDGRPPRKADTTPPDFVAEVISPDDHAVMVQEKVRDWLSTGVRLLWQVYPETHQVVVYHADGSAQTVEHDSVLDGGDVFPGLRLPVRSFLP